MAKVGAWLEELGLTQYGDLFAENEIDFDLLTELTEAGCLEVTGDKYPVLGISELGRAVLSGETEAKVAMPDPAVAKRPASKKKSSRKHSTTPAGLDEDLYKKLRSWRFMRAKKMRSPAYMVFNDAALEELAQHKPTTKAALLEIKGIGPSKVKKFGSDILEMIAEESGREVEAAPPAPKNKLSGPQDELFTVEVEGDGWGEEEFDG